MDYYLTLVSSDLAKPLQQTHIDKVIALLQVGGEPVWLAPQKAVDIPLNDRPSYKELSTLRTALYDSEIDVFCTAHHARIKKLVLADMDSTIIKGETLDDLAAHVGLKDKVSAITVRAMNGELNFHEALHERVALLQGLHVKALSETLAELELNPGARAFIRTMKAHGAHCVLVSGGFTFFTEAVAAQVGFHSHHGNSLEIEGEQLTGRVVPPILDKDSKVSFLEHYRAEHSLSLDECLAIGDGANDLPMLEKAGLGIGYQPKRAVAERIDNQIIHGDLVTALYAQGLVPI